MKRTKDFHPLIPSSNSSVNQAQLPPSHLLVLASPLPQPPPQLSNLNPAINKPTGTGTETDTPPPPRNGSLVHIAHIMVMAMAVEAVAEAVHVMAGALPLHPRLMQMDL